MPIIESQGIDDLYKVNNPDVDYVIIEYKFNTAKQGKIKDSIKMGRTETWLVNVMPDESSNIKVLDVNGKPKNIDTSKIILPNKSYNGAQL